MKKISTKCLSFVALLGLAFTANAGEIGIDYLSNKGEAVPGTQYTLAAAGDYYTYTPSESGLIEIQTSMTKLDNEIAGQGFNDFFFQNGLWVPDVYSPVNQDNQVLEGSGYKFTFMVTADEDYIIAWNAGNTAIKEGFSFEILSGTVDLPAQGITSIYPTPGTTYLYTLNKDITVTASANISEFGEVTVSYGSTTVTLNDGEYEGVVKTNGPPTGQFIQIGAEGMVVWENLIDAIASSNADSFTITIKDVVANGVNVTTNDLTEGASAVTVNDGTVTITYQVSPAPKYLEEESTIPSTVYAYSPAGSADAVVTLVFSQDIKAVDSVTLTMAAVVPGQDTGEADIKSYSLTPTISGETVTIDLAGVVRTDATQTVTLAVNFVTNTSGLNVNFGEYGSVLNLQIPYVNNVVTEDTPFTLGEEGLKTAVFIPSQEVANFYISSPAEFNIFEDAVVMATDINGEQAIELTPNVVLSDDSYVYTGTGLAANTPYYFIYNLGWGAEELTINLSEYVSPYTPVSFDEMFEVSEDGPIYSFLSPEEGDFYIVSNSDTDLLSSGALKIIYDGQNIFFDWMFSVITGEEGLVYAGYLQRGGQYFFQYTGDETIQLTLIQGTYGSVEMADYATVAGNSFAPGNPEAVVTLTWENATEIKLVTGEDVIISIPVINIKNEDILVKFGPDDLKVEGNTLSILVGASQLFNEEGTYLMEIPAGLVENEDGEINMSQDVTITVSKSGAINSIESVAGDAVIYNLQGQKVSNPAKGGIYIVNGKKVVLK